MEERGGERNGTWFGLVFFVVAFALFDCFVHVTDATTVAMEQCFGNDIIRKCILTKWDTVRDRKGGRNSGTLLLYLQRSTNIPER